MLFLTCVSGSAQNLQQEINDQVWKPFINTFSTGDSEGFMALHSKDVIRSARDGNQVKDWESYRRSTVKGDEWDKAANRKRVIELRFLERMASATQAVEVGIYKTTYINADGTRQDYFGKFLAVLRKENGTWKILVDTDSSEGGTINENSFNAAKPM